ncbi:MAG: hypothetical protein LC739_05995 [Actinobacteria bacterium]|nr:hypothetical protein [Actinomycetota bacterium]
MKRIRRIAGARWWLPLLVGLLGLGGGYLYIRDRNASITPEFEATAIYPVLPTSSEGPSKESQQSQETLRSAVDRAIEANQDLLDDGGRTIEAEQETFSIVFSARAPERNLALAMAEEMRVNYVVADFGAVQISDRMALMLEEAIDVSRALDALEPPVPTTVPEIVLDPETQARFDFLLIQIGALTSESARLIGDLVLAETGDDRNGTPEEIQDQIDTTKEKLEAIYLELGTIPGFDPEMIEAAQAAGPRTGPTGEVTTNPSDGTVNTGRTDVSIPEDEGEIAPGWQTGALVDRYAQLQSDYESLFTASIVGETGELDPGRTENVTPPIIPRLWGAAGGFALGALVGIAFLYLFNRFRRQVWVAGDVATLPVLAEVPVLKRAPKGRLGSRRLRHRRNGVRALRGSMLGILDTYQEPISIALQSVKAPNADTSDLILELSASLQAADRSVLVLDADFEPKPGEPAFGERITLADLLELAQTDAEEARTRLRIAVDQLADQSPWRLLPAGQLKADAADTLLSKPFGMLLNESLTHADLVLTLVPDNNPAAADALFQQVAGVVAVCRSRVTRGRDLARLEAQLEGRKADLLGAILLVGRKRRRSQAGWRRLARLPKLHFRHAASKSFDLGDEATSPPPPRTRRRRSETPALEPNENGHNVTSDVITNRPPQKETADALAAEPAGGD